MFLAPAGDWVLGRNSVLLDFPRHAVLFSMREGKKKKKLPTKINHLEKQVTGPQTDPIAKPSLIFLFPTELNHKDTRTTKHSILSRAVVAHT